MASFLDPILLGAYLTIATFGVLSFLLFVRMAYRLLTHHGQWFRAGHGVRARLKLIWSLAVTYNLKVFGWVMGRTRQLSRSRYFQRQADAVSAAETKDPILRSCFNWFLLAYQGYLVFFFVTFAHVVLFVVTPV